MDRAARTRAAPQRRAARERARHRADARALQRHGSARDQRRRRAAISLFSASFSVLASRSRRPGDRMLGVTAAQRIEAIPEGPLLTEYRVKEFDGRRRGRARPATSAVPRRAITGDPAVRRELGLLSPPPQLRGLLRPKSRARAVSCGRPAWRVAIGQAEEVPTGSGPSTLAAPFDKYAVGEVQSGRSHRRREPYTVGSNSYLLRHCLSELISLRPAGPFLFRQCLCVFLVIGTSVLVDCACSRIVLRIPLRTSCRGKY